MLTLKEHIYQILESQGFDHAAIAGDQTSFEVLERAIIGALEQIETTIELKEDPEA